MTPRHRRPWTSRLGWADLVALTITAGFLLAVASMTGLMAVIGNWSTP